MCRINQRGDTHKEKAEGNGGKTDGVSESLSLYSVKKNMISFEKVMRDGLSAVRWASEFHCRVDAVSFLSTLS